MNKTLIFKGAGVAIITPFLPDGAINFPKLKELIEFQIAGDTDAVIICGTTGEPSTMSDAEHKECISFAVDAVAGRIPVIAGTGSNDTAYAASLSRFAEQAGADGLLMVTPYYNKTTQAGLVKHYAAVAEKTSLPIIVYNVPSRTGLNVLPETYVELAKIPNIVACKEAGGDISAIMKTAALCGDSLYIYSGEDDQTLPILAVGGMGVISVVSNIMPREMHDICELYHSGRVDESRRLHLSILQIMKDLFLETNPIPVKTALNMMGFNVGGFRLPLCEMQPDTEKKLRATMQSLGLI